MNSRTKTVAFPSCHSDTDICIPQRKCTFYSMLALEFSSSVSRSKWTCKAFIYLFIVKSSDLCMGTSETFISSWDFKGVVCWVYHDCETSKLKLCPAMKWTLSLLYTSKISCHCLQTTVGPNMFTGRKTGLQFCVHQFVLCCPAKALFSNC